MPTCPNGHQAVAEDWCEVCGHRMLTPAAAPVPPAPPSPPRFPQQQGQPGGPGAPAQPCPQCGTPREAQTPFCENCRFNFLTNSPTTNIPPGYPASTQVMPGADGPSYRYPPQQPDSGYPGQPHQPQHAQPQHSQPQHSGDWVISPPGGPAPQPGVPPQPGPYAGQHGQQQPGHQMGGGWAVSIGPDPEYFAAMMRRSGPEASQLRLPDYEPEQQVGLTGPQVTIGRRRNSTGQSPDIDLSRPPADPGVSHDHAVLVQQPDGSWAVVDRDSTNGTTVNGADDPIQPFVPVSLKEGDRIHIGAWTTLTLYRS